MLVDTSFMTAMNGGLDVETSTDFVQRHWPDGSINPVGGLTAEIYHLDGAIIYVVNGAVTLNNESGVHQDALELWFPEYPSGESYAGQYSTEELQMSRRGALTAAGVSASLPVGTDYDLLYLYMSAGGQSAWVKGRPYLRPEKVKGTSNYYWPSSITYTFTNFTVMFVSG